MLLAIGLTPALEPDGSNDGPVDFTIYNSLGEGQISEQVTVVIDGKDVGTLTINEHYPNSRLKVTVPKPGQISYSLASAAVLNINGELFEYNGVGQGIINVEQGKDFSLHGSVSGNTWLITMIEGTTPTSTTHTPTAQSPGGQNLEDVNVWDTNGDGYADAWDTDGNGYADTWDTNGDQYADTWDTNGDQYADTWDTDGDWYADTWDTDGDGYADTWDTDGDGYADT